MGYDLILDIICPCCEKELVWEIWFGIDEGRVIIKQSEIRAKDEQEDMDKDERIAELEQDKKALEKELKDLENKYSYHIDELNTVAQHLEEQLKSKKDPIDIIIGTMQLTGVIEKEKKIKALSVRIKELEDVNEEGCLLETCPHYEPQHILKWPCLVCNRMPAPKRGDGSKMPISPKAKGEDKYRNWGTQSELGPGLPDFEGDPEPEPKAEEKEDHKS